MPTNIYNHTDTLTHVFTHYGQFKDKNMLTRNVFGQREETEVP